MKKTLLVVVSLLMVLSMLLAACATPATPAAPAEPVTTEAPAEPVKTEALAAEPAKTEPPTAVPAPTEPPAPTEEVKEPVTITWVNWIGAEDATIPAVDAMIKGFQEKYPWITVESMPFPFNQTKDQLLVMSTGGSAPDVSMSHPTWNGPLVEAGVLEPLNDLPNLDQWPAASKEGWTYDGNLMAVTWTPSPVIVYYNKNLLAKAGHNEPPQTWDEMLAMARDVAKLGKDEAGNQIYGFGVSSKKLPGAGYFALPFLYAYGGKFLDDEGKVVLDTPENLAAFTELKALFDEGVSPEGLEIRDLRNLFATGVMGFHWDIEAGIGIFAGLSPKGADFSEDYGMIVMPGPAAGEGGTSILIEHNLVAFKDSQHKEEVELFIDFLSGPEGITLYNEAGNAKLPIRADTAQIDFYKQPENAFMQVFIDQLANAEPLPAKSSAFLAAMEEIANAIQRISVNDEEPAVVLTELDAAVKALYGQ